MKKIIAMAAVAALAAGASAFAANPFADVPTDHWAYRAVATLSDRGLVAGYPDGTFRGQQNITRFEMSVIVARLMAREDQMIAEDRAIIDRLAGEYVSELQNLGVRVDNLEKKIGNIAWTGDARMRYTKSNAGDGVEKYTGRIRLNARATVNDTTYVHGRLTTGNVDLKDSGSANSSMDRMYVRHQPGQLGATLGRYELDMGQQLGGWLYANAFDGVQVDAELGEKGNLAVGYGRFQESNDIFKKAESFYAKASGDFGALKLGVDYFKTSKYGTEYVAGGVEKAVWGVNVLIPAGSNARIFGDYYANTKDVPEQEEKGKIWTAGIGYGKKDLNKAGTFGLDVAYFKAKSGLYESGMTGAQAPTIGTLLGMDSHFWLATADVVLAKNTYVHGEYAFSAKAENEAEENLANNSWTLSLNYKF